MMQWIRQNKIGPISNVQDNSPQNYTEALCRAECQQDNDLCFKQGRIPGLPVLHMLQYSALTGILGKAGKT